MSKQNIFKNDENNFCYIQNIFLNEQKKPEQEYSSQEENQIQIVQKQILSNKNYTQRNKGKYTKLAYLKEYIMFFFLNVKGNRTQATNEQNYKQLQIQNLNIQQLNQQIQPKSLCQLNLLLKRLINKYKIYNLQQQQQTNFFQQFQLIYFSYQRFSRQKIQNKIISSSKFSLSETFNKTISILQIIPSKHYEIIKIKFSLLSYTTQILILNNSQKSPLHTCLQINHYGAFGNIYFTRDSYINRDIAIKCINFEKQFKKNSNNQIKSQIRIFTQILKQYFLLSLFSEIGIGPKIQKIGGFDMILSNGCVQFATQKCSDIINEQNLCSNLKSDLQIMHILQIVHRDIKPANIMFSPTFKRNVFIDFGASQVLNQIISEKTNTIFSGTASYSTQQILGLMNNSNNQVDLYYNDLFGFQKTIYQISSRLQNSIDRYDYQYVNVQNRSQNYHLILYHLKLTLFERDYQNVKYLWKILQTRFYEQFSCIQNKLLYFFYQLKPEKQLVEFYDNQIDEYIKNLDQFSQLKKLFKNENLKKFSNFTTFKSKQKIFQYHKIFFKSLFLDYGKIQDQERYTQTILQNKHTMINFLNNFHQKHQQIFQQQKKNLRKQDQRKTIQHHQSWISYCLITINYCTFSQNKHNVNIQQKLMLAQKTINFLQKEKQHNLQRGVKGADIIKELWFKCVQQGLVVLAKLFQYLLFRMWEYFPDNKYKVNSFIQCLTSLLLIGYPTHLKYSQTYILALVKQSQMPEYKKKILNRATYIIFFNFRHYCSNKVDSRLNQNLRIQVQQANNGQAHNNKEPKNPCKNLSRLQQNSKSPLTVQKAYNLNKKIFQSFLTPQNQYLQDKIAQNKIKYLQYQINKKSPIKQKQLQLYVNLFKPYIYFILVKDLGNYRYEEIKNKIVDVMVKENQCYEEELVIFTIFYEMFDEMKGYSSQKNIYFILQKIDLIINYQPLSLRYKIQNRLISVYNKKNTNQIKKIINIIVNQFTQPNSYSICQLNYTIKRISYQIKSQLIYLQKISHQQFLFYKQLYRLFQRIIQLMSMKQSQISIQTFKGIYLKQQQYSVNIQIFCSMYQQNLIYRDLFHDLINFLNLYNNLLILTQKQNNHLPPNYKIQQKQYSYLLKLSNNKIFNQFQIYNFQIMKKYNLIKYFKENKKYILDNFMQVYLPTRKTTAHLIKTIQIIDQFYDQFQAQDYIHPIHTKIIPILKYAIDYVIIKLQFSQYQMKWCKQIISYFNYCVSRKNYYDIFVVFGRMRVYFNAFVYDQQSYQSLQQLFYSAAYFVSLDPVKQSIEQLIVELKGLLWCKCGTYCFPRPAQNWNPAKFVEFLAARVDINKIQQNPYMSFVYFNAALNKQIDPYIRRKFFKFIKQSIHYLSFQGKNFFYKKMFEIILPESTEKLKMFIFSNSNQIQFNPKLLTKDKNFQKIYHHFQKSLKSKDQKYHQTQQIIKKHFIKQRIIKGYRIPHNIRQLFIKKLRKFYTIKKNHENDLLSAQKYQQIHYQDPFQVFTLLI